MDAFIIRLVADNMLVKILLPDIARIQFFPGAAGNGGFECPDDRGQGTGCRFAEFLDLLKMGRGEYRRGTIYRAPTTEKFGKPVKGSIPTIIRTFKAAVSRRARTELELMEIWQRNYYEHIIRNEQELIRVWDYIDTNPIRWQDDRLYPDIPPTGKKP